MSYRSKVNSFFKPAYDLSGDIFLESLAFPTAAAILGNAVGAEIGKKYYPQSEPIQNNFFNSVNGN